MRYKCARIIVCCSGRHTPTWMPAQNANNLDGKIRMANVSLRKFWGISPLIPRLKRMFASSRTAKDLQWHGMRCEMVEGQMSHPADGKAWKHFNDKYNWFAKDARNLRLAVATDGFNPFGNFSTTYSMFPVLVMPLNLQPWECVNLANCFCWKPKLAITEADWLGRPVRLVWACNPGMVRVLCLESYCNPIWKGYVLPIL